MKEYTTIADEACDEFIEKRSRFIGHIRPVQTEQAAMAFVSEKKSAYWDASHNVYAYILREGQTRRYSDDGEPQGTAGMPVLNLLQKEGLTDVAVVVTRYFGGILLGGGGLVRAYSHGAKLAVDAAARKTMSECTELALGFGYDFYGKLAYLLPKYHAVTLWSDFAERVELRILMKDVDIPAFEKELAELSAAQVTAEAVEHRYGCIPE